MDGFLVTYHATINISHCKLKISFVVNVAVRVATCCTKCISILHSPQLVSVINTGNPKTLTPGLRTPHYVPGPQTLSMDPSVDHPPTKIKKTKIKISLTAVSLKFRVLRWVNVTDLGSVSDTSYVIVDHYIIAIFFAVALHERPGSL